MRTLRTRIGRRLIALHSEVGAVATEYGLILTLVAIVLVASLFVFGVAVSGLFDQGTDGFPP